MTNLGMMGGNSELIRLHQQAGGLLLAHYVARLLDTVENDRGIGVHNECAEYIAGLVGDLRKELPLFLAKEILAFAQRPGGK